MQGTIVNFFSRKGFGFIERSDGQQIFVHVKQVVGRRSLSEGMQVRFEMGEYNGKPQAVNVEVEGAEVEQTNK